MDSLVRLKDTFARFLSPAKRRRTIGPITPSKDEEPKFLLPNSEPRGTKAQAEAVANLKVKYYATPAPKNPRKRAREEEEVEDEPSYISSVFDREEGDTTAITDFSAISPHDSISQVAARADSEEDLDGEKEGEDHEVQENHEDEYEEDDESEESSSEARVQEYLAQQRELVLRKEEVTQAKAAGNWHPYRLFLFEKLAMRSFEPILPAAWHVDFPALPHILFSNDPTKHFINSNCTSSARGLKALKSLLSLGTRVRDNVLSGHTTEKIIAREVKSYIKWSEKDGGFSKLRFIPVLSVITKTSRQSIDATGVSIRTQLKFLAEQHRKHLEILPTDPNAKITYRRAPPLLYGILIAQTKVILVTWDSADLNADVNHLTHVELKDDTKNIWNELAVAFMVIMARNYTMSIKDELEADDESEPDPDL